MAQPPRKPKIVVGVDGSVESFAALRAAYLEALARGGELVIVYAWRYPASGPYGDDRRRAESELGELVEAFRRELDPLVPIVEKLVGGDPRIILVNESFDADLVVIGSGGQGRARLGPVGTYVLRHAVCPVEVVPAVGAASRG